MVRVLSVEECNEEVRSDVYGYIVRAEERYHQALVDCALTLMKNWETKPFVLIAGPSGSGKTTSSIRLKKYLESYGVVSHTLSLDDYFFSSEDHPKGVSFEAPESLDIRQLEKDLKALKQGEKVTLPRFNFVTHQREVGETIQKKDKELIIMEGLHALNPKVTGSVQEYATGLYVAPRTRLELDSVLLEPEQLRLARRLLRDHFFRSRRFEQIAKKAQEVNEGENIDIRPFKKNAALHVDTYIDYELHVIAGMMKQRGPLMGQFDVGFIKEYNLELLLDVMDALEPIPEPLVPQWSVLREFIGGSPYV